MFEIKWRYDPRTYLLVIYRWLEIYRWLITFGRARWLIEILSAILKARGMEDSQEKDYSFLWNDTFPNLYDALVNVYEWKFKSEYLEREIYERLLKSEPSIVKLIENKSDLLKLSTLSEPSIVKFIENQSEHLSKLTLYHLWKNHATRRSRRAREPSRIHYIYAIPCPNGPRYCVPWF